VPRLEQVVARAPGSLISALRTARVAVLWSLGPVDWAFRVATGRGRLPPLWLRRHIGPLPAFERACAEITAVIAMQDLVRRDSRILDIGCASGSMVPDFQRMLGPEGSYVGFDVHAASIEWCRRRFADDRRFTFQVARIRTPFSPQYETPAEAFRFPVDDASVDFALAKSVFTHMREGEMRRYLSEIRRVLAPGGAALVTAFLLNEGPQSPPYNPPMFDFAFGNGTMRWAIEARPEAALAYDGAFFRSAVGQAGLGIRRIIPGFWSGRCVAPNAQDLIVVEHA
jgi:ubiquinone/menaquinone biosynthesis C-methylase UbiE